MGDDTVTLRPDRWRAGWWSLVGLVATGLGAWAFSASTWSLLYAVLCALCALPTAVFLLQLLAPDMWTLQVDRTGLRGYVAAFEVVEPFVGLRSVELGRLAGEPVLVLRGRGRRRLLLPVGSDLVALRRLLPSVDTTGSASA